MKKLSRIKLQNAVQLESNEMKVIFGGSGNNNGSCSGGGFNNPICSGECPDKFVWNPSKMLMDRVPQKCNRITNHAADGSGSFTTCYCS